MVYTISIENGRQKERYREMGEIPWYDRGLKVHFPPTLRPLFLKVCLWRQPLWQWNLNKSSIHRESLVKYIELWRLCIDSQLKDIARFCASEKCWSSLGVDPTFNTCNSNTTINTYTVKTWLKSFKTAQI